MALAEMNTTLAENARGPGAGEFAPSRKRRRSVFFTVLRHSGALVGLMVLGAIIAMAATAPLIRPGDPLALAGTPLLWPGQDLAHPLGTDNMGRDVLAGIMHGARVSLLVGVAATALGVLGGVSVGAVAGYFGGRIDNLIVRFIEIFQTIPGFVLLVVLVAVIQPSIWTVIIGIALTSWDTIARLTRAEFRTLRQQDYVSAARSVGYGDAHIILREIIPNALPPLVVTATIMVASAILSESALAFLGLGDPNSVSWGAMIGTGREYIRTHWYLTAIPGGFIVATVFALNLIGDALNDALSPHLART
ncbi:ABC transporter permease [Bosea sp. 2KB_26]|uniref:ABC transporter permease n=1 Tax=Bosea sp. 2KB_26 TaxID=3237475 RepID=UPI000DE1AF03